jgi:phytoene synthase
VAARQDAVAEAVRERAPDRYWASLYAPAERRPALLALQAFDLEIASIRDRVREALPGEIRLQWWRDTLATHTPGETSGHPIADAMNEAIETFGLPLAAFDNYLEARIFDLYDDPMPSRTDLEGYCGETAGAILQMSAMILDAPAAADEGEASGHAACLIGIVDSLRHLAAQRRRGQCFIPGDILAAVGLSAAEFVSGRAEDRAAAAVAAMVALAREHRARLVETASSLPTVLRPAFLPAATASLRLDALGDPRALLAGRYQEPAPWRRHLALLKRATRGW